MALEYFIHPEISDTLRLQPMQILSELYLQIPMQGLLMGGVLFIFKIIVCKQIQSC
jgi:hypothetical protein